MKFLDKEILTKDGGKVILRNAELEVVVSNERAIKLYKSLGFEIYGTLKNNMKYKDGTYVDAYIMGCIL